MPKALSLDLRTRVARAIAESATVRSVAERFEVSASSAVRLGQKLRAGRVLSLPSEPRALAGELREPARP